MWLLIIGLIVLLGSIVRKSVERRFIYDKGYDYNHISKMKSYKCKRCGHEWFPRKEIKPVCCPGCKSPYWNKEKQ